MRWHFDPEQPHQLAAIHAVVDLFRGQGRVSGDGTGEQRWGISPDRLLRNLRDVQARGGLTPSELLSEPQFSVEMETGTGKTYVYLRTMMELYARSGLSRFVIVVPGVAIREGVLQHVEHTAQHLRHLYGEGLRAQVVRPGEPATVRRFASDPGPQVLVLNIDTFNKGRSNLLHRATDALGGRTPVEVIASVSPIVILDEPQNLEGPRARAAIEQLSPLAVLRYSATHRVRHHMVHRLDPVQAHDLGLVKGIDVAAVTAEDAPGVPLEVKRIQSTSKGVSARICLEVASPTGPVWKTLTVRGLGEDLQALSGGREVYAGYVVREVHAVDRCVRFENGRSVFEVSAADLVTRAGVMREQITLTVREHLERSLRIQRLQPRGKGMKVLSLFFIDRVAHYTEPDGVIKRWFEEAYVALAGDPRYASLGLPSVEEVHAGYFATRRGLSVDTSGRSREDDGAYELIMKDKERLLSRDEPVQFLFSHSALREGWDNPNVFQICTLHPTRSELRKRQEIGRGLRLPLMDDGHRCTDRELVRLLVVANEQYEDFARRLQQEIREDCGADFGGRIRAHRERRAIPLRDGWSVDEATQRLWALVGQEQRCRPGFDGQTLVERAASRIAQLPLVEATENLTVRRGRITPGAGLEAVGTTSVRGAGGQASTVTVPNVIAELQRETGLTGRTLAEILRTSGRLGDLLLEPSGALDRILSVVQEVLVDLLAQGASYTTVSGTALPLTHFEDRPMYGTERCIDVERGLHTAAPVRSQAEADWVRSTDADPATVRFLRWPRWIPVETPAGPVDPGWATLRRGSNGEEQVEVVRVGCAPLSEAAEVATMRYFESLDVAFRVVV